MSSSFFGQLGFTALLLSLSATTGCASHTYSDHSLKVRVVSNPPTALITRSRGTNTGQNRTHLARGPVQVGLAPLTYEQPYRIKTAHFNRWYWFLVGGSAALVGGGLAMLPSSNSALSSAGKAVSISAAVVLGLSLVGCLIGESNHLSTSVVPSHVTLYATQQGYGRSSTVVPIEGTKQSAFLRLEPLARSDANEKRSRIVAVFVISDPSNILSAAVREELTDILVTAVAKAPKYGVIPPKKIRQQIVLEKKKSYRSCFDKSCQIEIGKALAAQKALSTTLNRTRAGCILTAKLYDLRSEFAEKGSIVRSSCGVEGLGLALARVARDITR
jgi:hypothetical protein